MFAMLKQQKEDFNSLPHTEVDDTRYGSKWHVLHFNSLPHTEVDRQFCDRRKCTDISTHYLTQR